MAVFEVNAKQKAGTRSNTKLRVSGGQSPAGQWVTDKNLGILFHYDYGGPGQKEVVVSKGMLVGVAPERQLDDHLGFDKNVLTIATDIIRPFGMAPYNFSKHHEDFLDGNQPSVITREYIELPLLRSAEEAERVLWGAAYHGTTADEQLQPNDLVTWSRDPKNFGKIIKWVEGVHAAQDVIGQVGEIETDQEPYGWLKWAMWDETARREDQNGAANKSGYSAPGDGGYPFDPEYTRLGKDGEGGYLSQYTTLYDATGVKGILDGKNKAETQLDRKFVIPAATTDGQILQFALGYKNIIDQTVVVHVAGIETKDFTVDVQNGVVAMEGKAADANKEVSVSFRAEFFGTPAGWDHKGAVGAARILLKF